MHLAQFYKFYLNPKCNQRMHKDLQLTHTKCLVIGIYSYLSGVHSLLVFLQSFDFHSRSTFW
jgi:hypothetical protein